MNERLIAPRFQFIPVSIALADASLTLEAYLDTGFSGALSIPIHLLPTGISFDGERPWTLANDTGIVAPFVVGSVSIPVVGLRISAAISVLGSVPFAGRLLSDRLKLTLDHGRRLIVEP